LVHEDGVLVLISELCTDEFVWNFLSLFTMKLVTIYIGTEQEKFLTS